MGLIFHLIHTDHVFTVGFMNRYDGLDEMTVTIARVFAKRLKSKDVLRFLDIEDIEQELICKALMCLQTFDESKGNFEHYLRKVLSRYSISLLRFYSREKRGIFSEFTDYEDAMFGRNDSAIDINCLMNRLPNKYRKLCELLKMHNISEAAKIIGCSRMVLYRDLRCIAVLANHSINSEIRFFIGKGASMKNISVLETLSAKEISALDTVDLMDLNDQITNLNSQVKEMKQKLDDGLNLRFAETVKSNLQNTGKDTGTARFMEGGFQIIAEIPKKVTWDSEKMEEIIEKISKERKEDLIKITYSVDERKYLSLPPEWQSIFKEARTVTPGKTRFQIITGDQS